MKDIREVSKTAHLTPAPKSDAELLAGAESIKADPQHAHRTGASPHTVKSVRTDLESDLQIANDIPRVNARGQERHASYDRAPEPKSDAEPTQPDKPDKYRPHVRGGGL